MNTQMTLSLAVALVGALCHFTMPKTHPLAAYAWLAGLIVFLLGVTGKGVTCSL